MGHSTWGTEARARGKGTKAYLALIVKDIRTMVLAANRAWDNKRPSNRTPLFVKCAADAVAARVDVEALRDLVDYAVDENGCSRLGVRAYRASMRLRDDLDLVEARREEIRRRLPAVLPPNAA